VKSSMIDLIYNAFLEFKGEKYVLYYLMLFLNIRNGLMLLEKGKVSRGLIRDYESRCLQAEHFNGHFLNDMAIQGSRLWSLDDVAYEIFSLAGGEKRYFVNMLKNVYVSFRDSDVLDTGMLDIVFNEIISAFTLFVDIEDLNEFCCSQNNNLRVTLPELRTRPKRELLTDEIVRFKLDMDDGEIVEVPLVYLDKSKTILEWTRNSNLITLNNIGYNTLQLVIEFCRYEYENPRADETDRTGLRQFVQVDQNTLFELILAANYLDLPLLLDVTCEAVGNMIKGKTPEEIRVMFNIKNDFTPEEEEQIRRENEWIEERG